MPGITFGGLNVAVAPGGKPVADMVATFFLTKSVLRGARNTWKNRLCLTMFWSGRPDLNRGPPAPKAGALPGCATPRHEVRKDYKGLCNRTVAPSDQVSFFRFGSVSDLLPCG